MALNMQLTPFNIKLLQLVPGNMGNMKEIKSLSVFDGSTRNFHNEGLFSIDIFGRMGDKQRMRNFAFIDVKAPILHPLVVRCMGKLKRIYPEILHGRTYAIWNKETKDFDKSTPAEGQTGFTFFMNHWEELKLVERMSDLRELNIKFLNLVRKTATNERVIVTPAGYRDYVIHADSREESDEVNALYYRMLSLANTLTRQTFASSPASFDRTRSAMQKTFDEIYEYHEGITVGKNRLAEGKVMSRQVMYGTRNVIITQNLPVKELFAEDAPTVNSTGVGLFQFMKMYQPPVTYMIKTGYLAKVFTEPGVPANLVNPKTWRQEKVIVPPDVFAMWMTFEGMNKLFNLYGEEAFRHQEIKIGEFYIGLIYNDGKRYRIFNNIDELPENFERKYVRPVTYTELFYDSVYARASEYIVNVTRFPVIGNRSIYPSIPFLKPTLEKTSLIKLNENFEVDPSIPKATQFPIRGAAFLNAVMPAPNKLKGLDGDFDGDKTTNNGIMTDEGLKESHEVLNSPTFYVMTNGSIAHSMATDTVNYLIKGMMRNPAEIKARLLAKAKKPAKESELNGYHSPTSMPTFGSQLTHESQQVFGNHLGGAVTSVLGVNTATTGPMATVTGSGVFVATKGEELKEIYISDIGYPRTSYSDEEIDQADVNAPLVVTFNEATGKYLLDAGGPSLAKKRANGVAKTQAYVRFSPVTV